MDKGRLRAALLLPSFAYSYAIATGKPADCHRTKAPSRPLPTPRRSFFNLREEALAQAIRKNVRH
jgi:hypothetical protein